MRKIQMKEGDFAVFHSDMNSGRVRISTVDTSGYTFVHTPSCIGSAATYALDDDRLEPCPSDKSVCDLRRAWLKRHPEIVALGRDPFYKRAFDDAGLGVFP